MTTTIYLIGDIHSGTPEVYDVKKTLLKSLTTYATADPDSMCILAGDLTEHGYGKSKFICCPCFPWLCMNTCSSTSIDEVQQFIEEVAEPLRKVNPNTYFIMGNHDESTDNMNYPMLEYIKSVTPNVTKHGNYFVLKNDILFVFLGKYPDKTALNYFDMIHKNNEKTKYPYVIIQHYNFTGLYSDLWTDSEKDDFFKFIDDKNVLVIFHGHIHTTFGGGINTSSGRVVPIVCGSGMSTFAKVTIDEHKQVTFAQCN